MSNRVNKVTLYNDFREHIFKGDDDKCKEWWYHTPISMLDNLTMADIVKSPKSWREVQSFLVGYLMCERGDIGL